MQENRFFRTQKKNIKKTNKKKQDRFFFNYRKLKQQIKR